MDADRFDSLARSIVPTHSRRVALRLAAGAIAAFGVGGGAAEATHRGKTKCKHGTKKCNKTCCKKGELCAKGTCVTGLGTCKAGADACAGTGDPFCFDASGNHECICLTRIGGGTRCGYYGNGSACDQCASDADCVKRFGFPPGSSCTEDSAGSCICNSDARGTCIIPCGVKDPIPAVAGRSDKTGAAST